MSKLRKYVCNDQTEANKAKGILTGEEYTIIVEPEYIAYGSTDMSNIGEGNHPYASAWVVIGKK